VASRIKKQVETVFLNGAKRVAGLTLLGQLMNLELQKEERFDLINWFCASLRNNKNSMSHYLEDMRGCGHHLEMSAKEGFFQVLKGLVKTLKESKDEEELKLVLNALRWKFSARDHDSLSNLQVFRALHSGGN